ncbi:ADP-ribosylglycohydrolase family protein [Photobacterium galatheae]|nr:ADP-ribosylglycohydrolase family protein [Photobacterium galatheae]MCM0149005.1 ADP-ribosylglycohydrolase family protein [Photobacterium galatheae]
MKGTVIGDVIGSHYEIESTKGLSLPFFVEGKSHFTEGSLFAIATAAKLIGKFETYREAYRETELHIKYMNINGNTSTDIEGCENFLHGTSGRNQNLKGSLGNGAAMRVSPVAYVATSKDELFAMAKESSTATHDTPEAVFAAQAVALAIFRSLEGMRPDDIHQEIAADSVDVHGGGNLYSKDMNLASLHRHYQFTTLAYESVPYAIWIGLKANSFEEAIRYSLHIGGDTNAICSIAGAIAEARLGIPNQLQCLLTPLKENAPEYYEIMSKFCERYVKGRLPHRPKRLSESRMLGFYIADVLG